MSEKDTYVAWFEELGSDDVAKVGGKNASLGEMVGHLNPDSVVTDRGWKGGRMRYRVNGS